MVRHGSEVVGSDEAREIARASDEAREIARACLAAWAGGDPDRARSLLDDKVSVAGPLGAVSGADAYVEGIRRMQAIVERVEEREVFAEGDNVCIVYELVTKAPLGNVPAAAWYRIHDGKVVAVRVFYDSRRLVLPPTRLAA